MSVAATCPTGVGDLLREWRQRRRLSQMDLSNEAEVSARHLSFVETGRTKPSRGLLAELKHYPGVSAASTLAIEPADLLFAPLVITSRGRRLTFFSTLATFGTALDITMAELAIESFYPGDAETAEALRRAE